jgi:hypothetical protein
MKSATSGTFVGLVINVFQRAPTLSLIMLRFVHCLLSRLSRLPIAVRLHWLEWPYPSGTHGKNLGETARHKIRHTLRF